MTREQELNKLRTNDKWDIIVIGGGATGLGVALDAVLRGYKTLLIEQSDFAKGTSSRSTKLVHGGVRYLAKGQLGLVYEALKERGIMATNAPHLVRNQTFVIPIYSFTDSLKYGAGLKFYDLLSGKMSLGASHSIDKEEVVERFPTLQNKDLKGGIVYHDGQFDDARMAIHLAKSISLKGGSVLNYMRVDDLLKDKSGEIIGVKAYDIENKDRYEFIGKVIVNATGVFADSILKMDNPNRESIVKPSCGVHIVLDNSYMPGHNALMIPKTPDGRVLFALPWHGKVLIGTTDIEKKEKKLEPKATKNEIEFILDTLNRFLIKPAKKEDILSVFAGLRPLVKKEINIGSKNISRSHKIIISSGKLITIIGGKWTTYRKMGKDVVNLIEDFKKWKRRKSISKHFLLHGSSIILSREDNMYIYGSDKSEIIQLSDENSFWKERIHKSYPFINAEVIWAVRREMARTIDDILSRRIRLLFLDARAAIKCAEHVGSLMKNEMKKDDKWYEEQIKNFRLLAEGYVATNYY